VLECLDIVLEDKTKIWRKKNHAAKKDKKLKESSKKMVTNLNITA